MSVFNKTFSPQMALHPGETLSEKLNEIGMSAKEFSIRSKVPVETITSVMNGETRITQTLAVQFESVLKIPAHFWMNKQRVYDDYLSRESKK